jgi:hypothetical protein
MLWKKIQANAACAQASDPKALDGTLRMEVLILV